ncbi:CDGSH iron-sulfur domain-containing protein 3, mitochondrial-like isoform X3 [Periophthalmus magnuspinnatus]|uniref:CDGSH iron-sulfur domain-containing protein 3, mitochondrial-like isoform X3 n=1 Tax=Periophthalmus magnuspinnatus TaxID=409849 RepID=UPI00145AD786|nr:CDGSH iron-sulfur domain-containing protein 3, mitochondrial-like isoform X3 [Periophthalmus magnuspinnatus]
MNTVSVIVAMQRGCLQTFRRPQLWASSSVVQCHLQSTDVIAAARIPYRVKLKAGKRYAWCACGHSQKQPFCDGTHRAKAPNIEPMRFTAEKNQTVLLCACKQTRNGPYCDGTHIKVIFNDVVNYVKRAFKK